MGPLPPDDLFRLRADCRPRIASFENPSAKPGQGGSANKGAKGRAFQMVASGERVTLLDFAGSGVIRHLWMTLQHRSPEVLRAIRLDMFWDGAEKPAVSAPLGDFFGTGLGVRIPFQSVFFKDPEGRSFNCTIPMPFRTSARIVLTNESDLPIQLFYSIGFTEEPVADDAGYFHAFWNRTQRAELGVDHTILPQVKGTGRFLGTNIGVIVDPGVLGTWFGEGEVKMYLDGDSELPTWVGTGLEDYVGSAYGLGEFSHPEFGCTLGDEKNGRRGLYRYHVSDPIYFSEECRVTVQVMGGIQRDVLREKIASGAEVLPVTVDDQGVLTWLIDRPEPLSLNDPEFPDGWVNFYRHDDYSSTAYFYLNRPSSELPALPNVSSRVS